MDMSLKTVRQLGQAFESMPHYVQRVEVGYEAAAITVLLERKEKHVKSTKMMLWGRGSAVSVTRRFLRFAKES